MGRFAEKTTVPVDKSRAEIENILRRYGADQFITGWQGETVATIGFRKDGRFVKFFLRMPERGSSGTAKWEQLARQRWRALCLVIKAKLEAVQSGISVFEDEFLANIQLANGQNVGDWLRPQLEETYKLGTMPKSLLGLPDKSHE